MSYFKKTNAFCFPYCYSLSSLDFNSFAKNRKSLYILKKKGLLTALFSFHYSKIFSFFPKMNMYVNYNFELISTKNKFLKKIYLKINFNDPEKIPIKFLVYFLFYIYSTALSFLLLYFARFTFYLSIHRLLSFFFYSPHPFHKHTLILLFFIFTVRMP